MKKLVIFLFIFSLTFISCNKDNNQIIELTIDELYDYCATNNDYPCEKLLNHEGEFVAIVGFYKCSDIIEVDSWKKNKKLWLYNSQEFGSINIEINIADNVNFVFEKLESLVAENDSEQFIKLRVSGKIIGHNLTTCTNCKRGIFLEIDNTSEVVKSD